MQPPKGPVYPRKPRQTSVKDGSRSSEGVESLGEPSGSPASSRKQASTSGDYAAAAMPTGSNVMPGKSVAAASGGSNLFFGESNFLTLVPSKRPGVPDNEEPHNGRMSFSIKAASTPQSHSDASPSTNVIHLSQGTERYLREEGALTFPSLQTCLPVIQAYFKWFHPCFPLLDRPSIARQLVSMDISPLLFQAMLFIGATYCDEGAIVSMGFRDRSEAKSLLYTRARLLFHADWEKDQITLIQSLFLMSFWRGESSDVRDVRDQDCDIELLTTEDLGNDVDNSSLTALGSPTPEHLVYPIKMVDLARLLGNIIDIHFIPGKTPTAQEEIMHLQSSLEGWRDSLPISLQRISDEDSPSVWMCLLHLAYNHLRILIYRSGFLRKHENDTKAALGAANQISRIAEDMLERKTLQTADGIGRRLAENRAQICLLGLKEVQKFWRINNTVLDLFLQYLDESIAKRLRGDGDTSRDEGASAVVSREGSSAGLVNSDPPAQEITAGMPDTNTFEDHYFNLLQTNWEGDNAIDDLGYILGTSIQTQSPGGPMQVNGLNFLERWL
ncbi:hypothetical protein INS49_010337 [Diaporthe citri]|uniref:uncharacterized protein n=1 Tax=Diaporthe citri TaxID=83186 RepID=UPI001C80F8B4|nr:uncharacterized protein INS49_010337 [Diaporthe citri]KAG6362108.1 hypothetical protein INS49_010337 [Diaporthe citri]